jgi:hypothetical protein
MAFLHFFQLGFCFLSGEEYCFTKNELAEAIKMAIKALEGVRVLQDCIVDVSLRLGEYMAIGTPEECLRNKDFLDFLSDKMDPDDFEMYLHIYNSLDEKGDSRD